MLSRKRDRERECSSSFECPRSICSAHMAKLGILWDRDCERWFGFHFHGVRAFEDDFEQSHGNERWHKREGVHCSPSFFVPGRFGQRGKKKLFLSLGTSHLFDPKRVTLPSPNSLFHNSQRARKKQLHKCFVWHSLVGFSPLQSDKSKLLLCLLLKEFLPPPPRFFAKGCDCALKCMQPLYNSVAFGCLWMSENKTVCPVFFWSLN